MKTLALFRFKILFVIVTGLICFLGLNPLDSWASGQIVFSHYDGGQADVWIMNDNGSNQTKLTDSTDFEFAPAFSPDGSKIVYVNETTKQLFVMDVDGGNKTPIWTSEYGYFGYPSWSPDGQKIVFRDGPYNNYDLFWIYSDGSSVSANQITTDAMHWGIHDWSPDGTEIVSSRRTIPSFSYSVEVVKIPSSGGSVVSLTAGGTCGYTCENDRPSWSPDGSKIAYDSGEYGKDIGDSMYPHDIYVMNEDGTNKQRLTTYSGWDYDPEWSPDGNKIAFIRGTGRGDIYVINSDGTGETRLTFTGNNEHPDWIGPLNVVIVDINPQSCPNPLNVKSKGVLPVAILGTETYDVFDIDVASLRLDGVPPIKSSYEDVSTPLSDDALILASSVFSNGYYEPPIEECDCTEEGPDGFEDLTLKFNTQDIVNALGEVNDGDVVTLTLTGELLINETPSALRLASDVFSNGYYYAPSIEGKDCVVVIKKGN